MNDLNVIDRFMQAFITYIDAGFGLLGGDVRFLTATLIGIDITWPDFSGPLAATTMSSAGSSRRSSTSGPLRSS